ncbi:MAG: hypothetical protein BMS9Abin20_0569 [Acidimicrobiia bacterium]|nr:MAG: hypothetical protein BMS9Abin20_0569 [Acidimicrobiia bacterium]
MTYLRTSRLLLPLLLLALLSVVSVPASAQSKKNVERARSAEDRAYQQLLDADADLADGLQDLERIQGQIYNLEWRIDRLGKAITEYSTNVDVLEERARLIVYEAYTRGGRNMVMAAFSTKDIQELITSQALFDAATTRELSQLDQLAAVGRQMDRLTVELRDKESEVQQLRVEQEGVVAHLEEDQAKADKLHTQAKALYAKAYARYKVEQARRAAAAAARSSGAAAGVPAATKGVNCPLPAGGFFIDTWGYPRSGGRTHKGTDIPAGYGSKLIAMRSGSIRLNSHPLGGRQVYVYGDDGITYYYAHLSGYPGGFRNGQRVSQGQVVGYVGSTGNATTNVLHLGMIVGGRYVNPYPTVRAAC